MTSQFCCLVIGSAIFEWIINMLVVIIGQWFWYHFSSFFVGFYIMTIILKRPKHFLSTLSLNKMVWKNLIKSKCKKIFVKKIYYVTNMVHKELLIFKNSYKIQFSLFWLKLLHLYQWINSLSEDVKKINVRALLFLLLWKQ